MVWFVVAGVTIFIGGLLIVVAEAVRHSRD